MMTLTVDSPAARKALTSVMPGVWQWSEFNDEKQIYFNGLVVQTPDGVVIIDPPYGDDTLYEAIEALGDPVLVVITNRDHERASDSFRRRFNIPVTAPELDAPLMQEFPETTFAHGDKVMDTFEVIHLEDQKSPGESALWMDEAQTLILGDALISKQTGTLTLLPPEKYEDRVLALDSLQGLRRVLGQVKLILLGDGDAIQDDPADVLQRALDQVLPEGVVVRPAP